MDELLKLLRQESHLHDRHLFPMHHAVQLRVHPQVFRELVKVAALDSPLIGDRPNKIMSIPVTVDATMDPGTWQLIAGEGTI